MKHVFGHFIIYKDKENKWHKVTNASIFTDDDTEIYSFDNQEDMYNYMFDHNIQIDENEAQIIDYLEIP